MGMWSIVSWLGINFTSHWSWTPTTKERWAVTIFCLAMILLGSLIVSRLIRLIIAIGVIAALLSTGLITGAVPG